MAGGEADKGTDDGDDAAGKSVNSSSGEASGGQTDSYNPPTLALLFIGVLVIFVVADATKTYWRERLRGEGELKNGGSQG